MLFFLSKLKVKTFYHCIKDDALNTTNPAISLAIYNVMNPNNFDHVSHVPHSPLWESGTAY